VSTTENEGRVEQAEGTVEKATVGIIGVGIMGSSMGTRLLACGHRVTLFDRNPPKVAAMVEKGARAAASPAEVAAASAFIITCVNSAAAVRALVFGPAGVVEAADASKLLIDMSSIDPVSTRLFAEDLEQRTGMAWVDAPLSGGAPRALEGRLTVMAGGTAEAVSRARAVMDSLCANYTHMGPTGAGQTTKFVNQILVAITSQAVAEAVRFAEAGGVDAAKIPAALAGGRADSRILQEFGPMMAARNYVPTGRIDNMLKDLEGVQALASQHRLPLPLTSVVSELHRTFVAAGLGTEHTAAIMKQFDGYRGER
jgi:2-hydroxy-3-oxopropionate reductase